MAPKEGLSGHQAPLKRSPKGIGQPQMLGKLTEALKPPPGENPLVSPLRHSGPKQRGSAGALAGYPSLWLLEQLLLWATVGIIGPQTPRSGTPRAPPEEGLFAVIKCPQNRLQGLLRGILVHPRVSSAL